MSVDARDVARLRRDANELAAAAAAVADVAERTLAGTHVVGESEAGLVRATADHRGRVTHIDIAPTGLTRTRGPELAHQVVQAVSRARSLAAAEYERALRGH